MSSEDSVSVRRLDRVERRVGRDEFDVDGGGRGTLDGDAGGSAVRFPCSFFCKLGRVVEQNIPCSSPFSLFREEGKLKIFLLANQFGKFR